MSRYTARIELRLQTAGAYQTLHETMEAAGYLRSPARTAPDQPRYATAEFMRESNEDLADLFESTRRTVDSTGLAFSVLVTESISHRWIGVRVCRTAS